MHIFYLTWMSQYHLVKLEMFITQVPMRCQRKELQNLSHLNCGLQICQISIQLITACGNTAREDVQNTHHWSGWTETATENGVDQAGSRRHCSSHTSVASSIAADQWYMWCIPLLQFPTRCYQLDSNLANLDATVEVGWILEFLYLTTQL